jgi:hypothetical protein
VSRALRFYLMTAATMLIVAATAVPATAGGVVDPAPIGPNNSFIGEVNNTAGSAIIHMACFGPVIVGQTGHPLSDQTVKALPVTPPTSTTAGYTGTAANSLAVTFTTPVSTGTPIVLHDWAVSAPIPTTLLLPCYGTGVATFIPVPSSPTARPATVTVTFVGQP